MIHEFFDLVDVVFSDDCDLIDVFGHGFDVGFAWTLAFVHVDSKALVALVHL